MSRPDLPGTCGFQQQHNYTYKSVGMWTVINLMHLSFSAFNNTAFISFSLSIYLRSFSTKPISCYSLCIEVKLKCVQNKYTIQILLTSWIYVKKHINHNFHRLTRTYQQLHKQVQCTDEKNYISDFRRNTEDLCIQPKQWHENVLASKNRLWNEFQETNTYTIKY